MALGTCCLMPSPLPLPQGLILVAAAPEERIGERLRECLVLKPALAPPSSQQKDIRTRAGPSPRQHLALRPPQARGCQ